MQHINHFRHNFSINCIEFVSKWSISIESRCDATANNQKNGFRKHAKEIHHERAKSHARALVNAQLQLFIHSCQHFQHSKKKAQVTNFSLTFREKFCTVKSKNRSTKKTFFLVRLGDIKIYGH